MTSRLLLGAGSLLSTVADSLAEQPGSLRIGTTDEHVAESLTEQGHSVDHLSDYDRFSLQSFDTPDIVAVFESTLAANRTLAEQASDVFPNAHLVAYAGAAHDEENEKRVQVEESTRTLEDIAQTVIDPGAAVVEHVSERIGESGQRMQQLQRVLRDIDSLGVITHDNPDPDAIASGISLARLATAAGCDVEVCYYGEITHQENRAFINVLDIDLRNLTAEDDLSEFDGLALVDHSRPGVNDQLPTDSSIDIVIDHHPPRSPVDARFVDLRSNVGATSTLFVDYLNRFNIPIEEKIATALLFGIHVDTNGFSREVSQEDFTAAAKLVSNANFGVLERVDSPSVSTRTFETIAKAITNRRIEGTALLSCVGMLSERDALAQAADRLLNLEGITTTLVYGIKDGTIFISARSRGGDVDIGESLREAFGQIGSAGGHVDMAGAQIELGVLESVEDREESLTQIVEALISSRFLDVLSSQPEPLGDGVYRYDSQLTDKYLTEAVSETDESHEREQEPDTG